MIDERSYYADMSSDEWEEVSSNFLIDSWSFSRVSEFSRNEKAFEMQHIYGLRSKMSSTTIAGIAYHAALDHYFTAKAEEREEIPDIADLERIAYAYIDEVNIGKWKLQKTTPTIEDCIETATKTVSALLRNFYAERSIYEDDIKRILSVEVYCNEFLTINGVPIPLPCHSRIDMVVLTKEDKVVVVDHKSKKTYTDESELTFSIGRQAITYKKAYESKTGIEVDEVWFVENKFSKNKDNSKQLHRFSVTMDLDTCRLYEALLYEPLKRMLEAVSDPDHVFMINDSDNFIDKAEIYDFWCMTMIAEIEAFNVPERKKEMVSKRLRKIRDAELVSASPSVIRNFQRRAADFIQYDLTNKDMTFKEQIEFALRSFGVMVQVEHEIDGYSSNTYLLQVAPGVPISKVFRHQLDVANVLNVSNVRMPNTLVMFDGKSYVAIEQSKKRTRDVLFDPALILGNRLPIGKDNFDQVLFWDLDNHSTPHMLVCGSTGSGKSVFIVSLMEYAKLGGVKRILIMDPKCDKAFMEYADTQGFEVHNDIGSIEEAMAREVENMNRLVRTGNKELTLIIFDEFADALMSSRSGSELDIVEQVQIGFYAPKKVKGIFGEHVEPGLPKYANKKVGRIKSLDENLQMILQKGRSAGYRVIAAMQRGDTTVLKGNLKVNLPVRVCFNVPTKVDSQVVLDEFGAESLAGYGDGLIRTPEYPDVRRFQSFYKPQ